MPKLRNRPRHQILGREVAGDRALVPRLQVVPFSSILLERGLWLRRSGRLGHPLVLSRGVLPPGVFMRSVDLHLHGVVGQLALLRFVLRLVLRACSGVAAGDLADG